MLKIENLHVRVAGKDILKGLTLEVNAGEMHAVMGPNGAGKSTLSYVLTGRGGYEVTGGTATLDGEAGLQHGHLQDLHPLLLAAGEADIQRSLQHLEVDLEGGGLSASELEELHRR